MNVIDFAILSGLGQCFGYPRRADFIPTTDKMQQDIVKVQHRNLGLGLGLELHIIFVLLFQYSARTT